MKLRTARLSDAASIAGIYAPIVRETAVSFEADPPTAGQIAARIETGLETYPWLVAEQECVLRGYAYAGPHRSRAAYRWACDVSIYVGSEARRCGVGRRLYRALFEILRRQNYAAAFAGITLPNPASVALHEALGFEAVGVFRKVGFKLGAWHDVGWWRLGLRDPDERPPEPIPFSALDGTGLDRVGS